MEALFSRGMTPGRMVPFRNAPPPATSELVGSCKLAMPNGAVEFRRSRPAAGKFRTLAIKHLLASSGLGGSRWLGQFDFGFPIADRLSQTHLFEPDGKDAERIPPAQLYDAARPQFRVRDAKSGHKQPMCYGANQWDRWERDGSFRPQQLHSDGRPLNWRSDSVNIRFRFAVLQADKLRACGDLKHSITNLACSVSTPIQLVSRGPLAQLSHLLSGMGDWALFRADHAATYKQLPIDPTDQWGAILLSF